MKYLFSFAVVFFFLTCSTVFGQKQNNTWYFDDSLGIDFNGPKPSLLTDGVMFYHGELSPLCMGEGDACISDRNTGKILFYTPGHRSIFNRKHHLMDPIHDTGVSEIVNIIPMGCDTTKYIICDSDDGWSLDGYNGGKPATTPEISYVIVDMTQDSGNGKIITPPYRLLQDASDRLVAIPHANGTDSWIISHSLRNNYYYAWHVSSRGVNPTPVLSSSPYGAYTYSFDDDEGTYNASPDGKTIVDIPQQSNPMILDFDPATGQIKHNRILQNGFRDKGMLCGCFSPDNSKLYLTDMKNLFQVDMKTDNVTLIDSVTPTERYVLELGPDGKIYTTSTSFGWLGIIENPNADGKACNYNPFGFYLGGKKTDYVWGHLPTNMVSYPNAVPGNCNNVTADFMTIPLCNGGCLSFSDWSNGSPTSWKWSFPGGKSAYDTGYFVSSVCYDTAGLYPVTLIVNGPNGADTIVKSVLIDIGSRMASPVIANLRVKAGTTVTVPINVRVPASLKLGSTSVSQISISILFDPTVLDIKKSDFPSRILPPPGWTMFDAQVSNGLLTINLTNPILLPVHDSLVLGEVTFDVLNVTPRGTSLSLGTIELRTPTENIHLCTEVEGNFLARITIDSAAASVRTSILEPSLNVHPNPFSSATSISFQLDERSSITLEILDELGKTCAILASAPYEAGSHEIKWNSDRVPSGSYFVRLRTSKETLTKKIEILK